jgi:DNA-directed RNA polymerase
MSDLKERQEMRELTQLSDGVIRFKRECDAQEAGDTKPARGLVFVAMRAMVPWITEQVGLLEDGKTHPSQVPASVHWMTEMDADAVAYIAAKICVSAAYNEAKTTRTAMRIKAARWTRSSTRRKIMRKAADVAGVRRMGWTEEEKLKLGVKLIEVFVEQTGMAELKLVRDYDRPNSTPRILTMTEAVRARLNERKESLAEDDPVHRPMICKPAPWVNPTTGGYLTPRMKTTLVRGAGHRKVTEGLLDEMFSSEMQGVYDAVNAVQDTAWRVNRPIYELMKRCRDDGINLGDLPTGDKLPLPPLPPGLPEYDKKQVLDEKQQAQLDEWKGEARGIHGANAAQASKWAALSTKLLNAGEVLDEGAIYFPHALDFRGRLYPMSAELSPQSDDVSKALLEFSEGKPLGESGGYWLCVHLANLWGEDKVSFNDRVVWTQANHDLIMRSAQRPLDHTWWSDADEPWCFLAACFEYAAWQAQGDGYDSHLPVAMDGSCSGLQHFSAMLRDQRGAAATNLTATSVPSDIYTEVLEVVKAKLNDSKEPLAKVWHDKIDRKIVKRPCMTYAYGVTSVGIRDQITDEIRKRQGSDYLPGTRNWDAARFLAPFVEDAIKEVVERAAEAMDWLKAVSKTVSKQDIPTGWTTPLGFKVLQPYLKTKGKRLDLLFNGQRLQLTLTIEGTKIDSKNQTLAIAPNFVHSMDATHLMMTVNRLKAEGITVSFAVIHDSFGVHACDVDELHYALRDEFINLYSDSEVLVEFHRESLLRVPEDQWADVEPAPEAGEYDIEEVRRADFFFS